MYESLYGFSSVLALVGSNLNSDGGLAAVHETKDTARVSAHLSVLIPRLINLCVRSSSPLGAARA